jgi:hypothetical protein
MEHLGRWGGGRRFESVRGLRFVPAERLCLLPESAAECFVDVHPASTAWTLRPLRGVVGVEQCDCVLAPVGGEVAVVAVDHVRLAPR